MTSNHNSSLFKRIKSFVFGKARNFNDASIFHKISLVAFFAWIGLGADGLSSSCYGPAEAFVTLGEYHYLGIFVALGTAFTVIIISMSYSQTIELFPSGGGGYLVASKLHSPIVGMISGSALLIDYILTIAVSITAGVDAIFSFLPIEWHVYKISITVIGCIFMIIINLRGVKESILILAPIFLIFIIAHTFAISYSITTHFSDLDYVASEATHNINVAYRNLGIWGMIFIIMKAFSMGAGTFTGIEAVSNGLSILREPKVKTGKKTMRYMAGSLAFTAMGLMLAFLIFKVAPESGKTLNAVLFEKISIDFGGLGDAFVWVCLLSEAAILFVAAQAGFIDGPRILANMAVDKWMPANFSLLSDRMVTRNGILFMGLTAILVIILSNGRVEFLIILYSINVFITFILTESGMVKHWVKQRRTNKNWMKKLFVNGIALILDIFIIIFLIVIKFNHGAWITIFVTGLIVVIAIFINRHYTRIGEEISNLNSNLSYLENEIRALFKNKFQSKIQDNKRTAIILVNGYNGTGLNLIINTIKKFGIDFSKIVFVQVGVVDAGIFKGSNEIENLRLKTETECNKYKKLFVELGIDALSYTGLGYDPAFELVKIIRELNYYYLNLIVFSGQIILKNDNLVNKLLHNNVANIIRNRLFELNIPYVMFPINVKLD